MHKTLFRVVAIWMGLSVVFGGVPKIANSIMPLWMHKLTLDYVGAFLIYSLPFLILGAMCIRWSGKTFKIKEVIQRLAGSFCVYSVYVYMLHNVLGAVLNHQEGLRIIYPISIPILIPFLYFVGYLIADVLFDLLQSKYRKS